MPPPFSHRLRVRYSEADAQAIVFNSRYVEYLDIAMTEWFRWAGWDYPDLVTGGCDPSVVSMHLEWQAASRFDEELEIIVTPRHVGSTSFTLGFEIQGARDHSPRVTARIVYVNVEAGGGSSRPIPPDVRAALRRHLVP